MYRVFKKLQSGEFIEISCCDAPEEALELVTSLSSSWPGNYAVRDVNGRDLRHKEWVN